MGAIGSVGERNEQKLVDLQIVGLDGEGFEVKVPESLKGIELRDKVRDHLPIKAGARVLFWHAESGSSSSKMLSPSKTLKEQGLTGENARLSFIYDTIKLYDAWVFLDALRSSYVANRATLEEVRTCLEGITKICGLRTVNQLRHLPESLHSLTLCSEINLAQITWPNSLRHLTFGERFDMKLDGMCWPSGLLTLNLGDQFSQPLEGVHWPSSLQSLTLGCSFNRSLEGMKWPSQLQSLRLGERFNQSLERVIWPESLQHLTFGSDFNQSLECINWPSCLASLSLGDHFNQTLELMAWPVNLRSLIFGLQFNQSIEQLSRKWSSLQTLSFGEHFDQSRVTWPSGLRHLSLGFNQSVDPKSLPKMPGVAISAAFLLIPLDMLSNLGISLLLFGIFELS
ncbi:unnamed protein product [Durusdinium trenchii]|uniref:Uncharacterized protein n=1 Tax=Durusdinium trenchii TaxID=1381693 RepID=A0ABP0QBT0_9DINO